MKNENTIFLPSPLPAKQNTDKLAEAGVPMI